MPKALLPAPSEPDGDKHHRAGSEGAGAGGGTSGGGSKRRAEVPTVDDCLQALAQLPGLVAMGILSPTKANSMRATYREILQHHRHAATRNEQTGLPNESILELMQRDPSLLSLLEPCLTQDQIAMILELKGERESEQT